MAALATGIVQYMIDRIGFGWSFTIFGGSASFSALLYFVEMKRGMKWRVRNKTEDPQQVAPTRLEEPPLPEERMDTEGKAAISV